MNKAKTLGIISIKGGVGKTTMTVDLGFILANVFNKKVLLVDANFSAPNLAIHLGFDNAENTIHDVVLNRKHTEEAIYEHELGMDIMPDRNQKDVYILDVNVFPGFPKRKTFKLARAIIDELQRLLKEGGLRFEKYV